MEAYTGKRPVWYDGTDWKGSTLGKWQYHEAITAGGSFTITAPADDNKPKTYMVIIRGNSSNSYYMGLLSVYRGSPTASLVSLAANNIAVANSANVLTVTNSSASTAYMYSALIELI